MWVLLSLNSTSLSSTHTPFCPFLNEAGVGWCLTPPTWTPNTEPHNDPTETSRHVDYVHVSYSLRCLQSASNIIAVLSWVEVSRTPRQYLSIYFIGNLAVFLLVLLPLDNIYWECRLDCTCCSEEFQNLKWPSWPGSTFFQTNKKHVFLGRAHFRLHYKCFLETVFPRSRYTEQQM